MDWGNAGNCSAVIFFMQGLACFSETMLQCTCYNSMASIRRVRVLKWLYFLEMAQFSQFKHWTCFLWKYWLWFLQMIAAFVYVKVKMIPYAVNHISHLAYWWHHCAVLARLSVDSWGGTSQTLRQFADTDHLSHPWCHSSVSALQTHGWTASQLKSQIDEYSDCGARLCGLGGGGEHPRLLTS